MELCRPGGSALCRQVLPFQCSATGRPEPGLTQLSTPNAQASRWPVATTAVYSDWFAGAP